MKPAVTFVLFLLCSLFSGLSYAVPAGQQVTIPSSKNFFVVKHATPQISDKDRVVLNAAQADDSSDEVTYAEEDDQDDMSEQTSFARQFIAFYQLFALYHSDQSPQHLYGISPQNHATSTRKFILQRVLRL